MELLSARGRSLATVPAPLRATGPGLLTLKGRAGNGRTNGTYRGALEFRGGTFGGVNSINAVPVDEYVKGVIPLESPASWPIEALKAQAVAARTYALTTSKGGAGFEQYPDTRSQVYGGASAEQPSTNLAADQTAGQLVTYDGTPVPTYFFSTSGGRTEDVENTTLGTEPKPWLRSVVDEYDSVSPKHRWGPIRMRYATAASKLRGLVKGRFKGVKVIQRGSSPRVVAADVDRLPRPHPRRRRHAAGPLRALRLLGRTSRRSGRARRAAARPDTETGGAVPASSRAYGADDRRASPVTSCPRGRVRACRSSAAPAGAGARSTARAAAAVAATVPGAEDRALPRALQGRRRRARRGRYAWSMPDRSRLRLERVSAQDQAAARRLARDAQRVRWRPRSWASTDPVQLGPLLPARR